jgi:hypothetical protein
MIRCLKEFTNVNQHNTDTNVDNKKTPLTLGASAGFTYDKNESDENTGLLIARNGTVAVDYDIPKKTILIRPDNNLALDSNNLQKFNEDLTSCEQLAKDIASLAQQQGES